MLEVRYEWNFPSWAVRSKPPATGMSRSYLEPNSKCMQKTGREVYLYWRFFQSIAFRKTPQQISMQFSINKGAIEKNHTPEQHAKAHPITFRDTVFSSSGKSGFWV